jgi:endonuclease/exonuclease/phosphatase family metal-dependent hydrolase
LDDTDLTSLTRLVRPSCAVIGWLGPFFRKLRHYAGYGLAAVVLSTGPAPLLAQEAEPEDTAFGLDVMTFNIRTAIGLDGDNVWPNRKELVAETIRASDPDVLGLQEVLSEQIDFLQSELSEYRWVGVDRGLNGGNGLSEATPIFYKYGVLVPIESGTFWLSDDPNPPTQRPRVSRIVTWARFHHLETRRQLYVYNTHFTLRRGPRQLRSAEQINERIAALPAESVVMVMGDFNAVAETSDTWQVATSAGLRDAWVVAEKREGPPVTANGFRPPPPGREGRIDWILVGGSVTVKRAATVLYSVDGHRPITTPWRRSST